MPNLTELAAIDDELHAVVRSRDNAWDRLLAAMFEVDAMSERITVLLDRRIAQQADD